MFLEMIKKIPTDENYDEMLYSEIDRYFKPVSTELSELYQDDIDATYYNRREPLTPIYELSAYLDAIIGSQNNKKVLMLDYRRSGGTIESIFASPAYANHIGLIINYESEVMYNNINLPNKIVLDGASDALHKGKQFFRIFQRPDNKNLLFVWTSKTLTPSQFYKLKLIQYAINKEELSEYNPIGEEVFKAFLNGNIHQINTMLNELLTSDELQQKRDEKFYNLFRNRNSSIKERLENNLKRAYENIKYLENQLAEEGTKIENLNNRLYALTYNQKSDEDLKELLRYVKKHRHITGMELDGTGIIFNFSAPLVYYTDFAIEKIMKNYAEESIEYQLFKVFLDKKFRLWTNCRIKFYPDNFNIEAYYRSTLNSDLIGQPHIDQYGCLGNHREGIAESAKTEDYIGAIEQINQAVMNMNFYDACVTNFLIRYLKNDDVFDVFKTWEDIATGEMITTKEVLRRSYENEETETDNRGEESVPDEII